MAVPISFLRTAGVIKNTSGDPNASGQLRFFAPGTNTEVAVYSDEDETTILTQPVTCDAAGRAAVFTDRVVDMAVYDSTPTYLYTIERCNAVDSAQVDVVNAGWNSGSITQLYPVLTSIYTSVGGQDGKYKDPSGGEERLIRTAISERGLSVKDYGAVGNGVTIDTTAIRNAISAVQGAGGKLLIFPPGTYLIDGELTVAFSGLNIVGAGEGVTTIKQSTAATGIFNLNGAYSFSIQDLTLTSTTATTSGNTGTALALVGSGVKVSNVSITAYRTGIGISGAASGVSIENCYILVPDSSGKGIATSGTDNAVVIRIFGNRIYNATAAAGTGVDLAGNASDIVIFGNRFDDLGTGIAVDSGYGGVDLSIISNFLEKCTAAWTMAATGVVRFFARHNALGSATTSDSTNITITAAAAIDLPTQGNYFIIDGTTNIDFISKRPRGDIITLKFNADPDINHNTATPGTRAACLIAGAAAFTATADDTITLIFDGTTWREIARAVI